jgi:hypothetical protein
MEQITSILTDLATCLCAQILTDDLPPTCFCGIVPGEVVALDYSGDCADECGMAWVRLSAAYPSTIVAVPSPMPGNCAVGIGIEVEMGIVRCISPGGEDGQPPEPAELAAAAVLQQADMMAMWRAVACCRTNKDWMIGTYTPFGPEGGLVGGTLALSILVL